MSDPKKVLSPEEELKWEKLKREELKQIKADFAQDSAALDEQIGRFVDAVAPYLSAPQNVSELINERSAEYLDSLTFFRLNNCTIEKIEDLADYLNEKIGRLFVALHTLNRPIIYGVVSRGGNASIIIGVETQTDETIIKSMLMGLLVGIEIESCSFNFSTRIGADGKGGFISAVPVLKIDDDKQKFELSTVMRSLNGEDYTVLFYAKPISEKTAQDKYSSVLKIRDICASVSKRNISNQESINDSKTSTKSTTRRGFMQEALGQLIRDKTFNGPRLIDSLIDGGIHSDSESTVETIAALSKSVSFDIQNGLALELSDFCDKAIERLKYGQSTGLWGVTISYAASGIACDILEACLCGELAKPTADILPMGKIPYSLTSGQSIYLPADTNNNPFLAPITSAELGMLCTPPVDAVPNFEMKQGKAYPMIPFNGGIEIGKVSDGHRSLPNMAFTLTEQDLNKHTFICGITGSGKTTTVKGILTNCDKPFMVIESAKKEYRNISLGDNRQPLTVYTLGKPEINCLQFDPFYVQCGINLQTHIDFLKDLFNASFSFYGPMPYILERCLHNIYKDKGWNLTLGYHPLLVNLQKITDVFDADYMKAQYAKESCRFLFPTMQDLKDEVKRYIEQELQYDGEVGGNVKTAILARLESLCVGSKGYMFNTHKLIDMNSLMQQNVVFELEGLADDSDKAFCVGLLVIFINEYRQVYKEEHIHEEIGLQHLLVIEEAHRLLKNIDTERSSENVGNPKGKAVEHFTNMIAEMRSYGQGVIIAEQIPSKLAPDVIKNSSNKIIQRVVSADDQSLVANTIGMKEEDAVYLGNMKTGVALCHKEGMSLPVCVNVNPVRDNSISDSDIIADDIEDIFASINAQMVSEHLTPVLDTISLKLLNAILALEQDAVAEAFQNCNEQISLELNKRGIVLLPGRTSELYGTILFDQLLSWLCNGAYSLSELANNELCEALRALCTTGRTEDLRAVQTQLTHIYGRKTRNHCILVISEILKHKRPTPAKLDPSIKEYFYHAPDDLVKEISEKMKGGAPNDGSCP